jgi:hypothetical protein
MEDYLKKKKARFTEPIGKKIELFKRRKRRRVRSSVVRLHEI